MKKVNFNKGWSFTLNDEKQETVDLPHDFSISQQRRADAPSGGDGGFFAGGYGEYEKRFVTKRRKRYFFMCDGAFGITEVFVNANTAFINKYGYNGFYTEITDFLRYDKENVITVRVNNKHVPSSRWYSGSGLYRDVYLCECDGAYICPFGAFVSTEAVLGSDAYMKAELSFYAEKNGEGVVDFEVFEDSKRGAVAKFSKYVYAERGENKLSAKFVIRNAKIWDVDTPNMYSVRTTLRLDGKTDTDSAVFGIRTVYCDERKGLLLNGKAVKLRGGCIHHDHGPIGTAAYADAEYRRVAKLKEAGFNAVRCSHNPQSSAFYDACDRLGMLVIDELFDYWTEGKRHDDSHVFFEDNYELWTELIVRRDRCHPSIIMWSTGNEIFQKSGRGYGYKIAKRIAEKVRSIDTSRPLTHALCGLWDDSEEREIELAEEGFGAEKLDYFSKKTAITADTVDIIGYNYLEFRIERDLERFGNRLIVNTETFPLSAYTTIKQLLGNPRIIGDFVWTAWDYFGETGIGHVSYTENGDGLFGLDYPYHISGCGDIDICGERRPQSYYREIAWGLRKDPYIAVRSPKLSNTPCTPSAWGFYECTHSWCWEDCEGMDTQVYVFGDCDKMVLEVNGKEVGALSRSENGVYLFKTQYHAGKIRAIAITDGKITGTSEIKTEGKASKISLKKEPRYLARGTKKPQDELIYVDVEIQDENGALCTQDSRFVSYTAQGADIIGTGSGNLTDTEAYTANARCVCEGRCLVILKKHAEAKSVTLCAKADRLGSAEITVD